MMDFRFVFVAMIFLAQASAWGFLASEKEEFLSCSSELRQQRWEEVSKVKDKPFVFCESLTSAPVRSESIRDRAQDVEAALEMSFLTATCLGVDPKILLPKFALESALISQIQNIKGKDTGLGQLTGPAIRDVKRMQKPLLEEVRLSELAECKAVSERVEKFGTSADFFGFPENQRCQLMQGEDGAVRNAIFSIFLHRLNQNYVAKYYRQYGISELLQKAGLNEAINQDLQESLVLLSYNSGAGTAVLNLKNYLESRIDFTNRKKQEEGASEEDFALVTKNDFDFTTASEQYRKLIEPLPKDEAGRVPSALVRSLSSSVMSFPVWLRVWQSAGAPGYVSWVHREAERISDDFGRKCVNLDVFKAQPDQKSFVRTLLRLDF
jgi:hypothetical protein